jgi:hypothetical protein
MYTITAPGATTVRDSAVRDAPIRDAIMERVQLRCRLAASAAQRAPGDITEDAGLAAVCTPSAVSRLVGLACWLKVARLTK